MDFSATPAWLRMVSIDPVSFCCLTAGSPMSMNASASG